MITNLIENDTQRKRDDNTNDGKITKVSSNSRTWSGLKDPRVVCVSRSFKGKDRHSKVCTIRGLRDRRVRLSVPTAIQLYDLQERLGLNQPSKVVDWLLNAAKHEIEKLPPLQIPPGKFGQYHQQMLLSHEVNPFVVENTTYAKDDGTHSSSLSCKEGLKINKTIDSDYETTIPKSSYWDSDALLKGKCKEVAGETVAERNNWIKRNEHEKQECIEGTTSAQVSSHSFFSRTSQSSLPGFLNNVMPFNSYYHLEPSNLSLYHLGNHGYSSQTDQEPHSYNVVPLPSSLSLLPGSQLLVCPSGRTPSFLPPYITNPIESDPRQINHFQMLSSSSQNLLQNSLTPPLSISQPVRPFQLNMPPKFLQPQNNSANQQESENSGPSSTPAASFFRNDPKAMHG